MQERTGKSKSLLQLPKPAMGLECLTTTKCPFRTLLSVLTGHWVLQVHVCLFSVRANCWLRHHRRGLLACPSNCPPASGETIWSTPSQSTPHALALLVAYLLPCSSAWGRACRHLFLLLKRLCLEIKISELQFLYRGQSWVMIKQFNIAWLHKRDSEHHVGNFIFPFHQLSLVQAHVTVIPLNPQ